jgi:hypothetical protein
MKKLRAALEEMTNPERFCDILSFYFMNDAGVQSRLLQEPVLERRFLTLMDELMIHHKSAQEDS